MPDKDPLKANIPDSAYALFRKFSDGANGFPHEAVVDAAANILMNAVRQEHGNWQRAEAMWDELFGRLKTVLRDHYDANGNRRNVFPYKQEIRPQTFVNQSRFNLKPN